MLNRVVRAVTVAGVMAVAAAALVGSAVETAEARQVLVMAVAGDPGDGMVGDPTDGEDGDPNDGEDGDPNDGSDSFTSGGGNRMPTLGDPGDGSEAAPNLSAANGGWEVHGRDGVLRTMRITYSGVSFLVYRMLTTW